MKIRALAFFLVAAVGCASAQNASQGPLGSGQPDLSSGDDTGGNGGDVDMADGSGGGGGGGGGGTAGGGGGGGGATQDMATPPDLAMPPADMSMPADMVVVPMCTPPSGSACIVYPQCGCAGSQACDIPSDSTSGNAVCVAPTNTNDWDLCTATTGQCKKGSTCQHGVCTPFCATTGAPSADCGGGTTECYQIQDASQSPAKDIPNLKICSRNCDPTNPQNATGFQPCGAGVNCFPDSDHFAWCLGPTTAAGTQGADCTNGFSPDVRLCAPGYYCVGSVSGTCYKMCKVASASCPGSTTCRSFSTKQYAGSSEIGYCK